MGVNHKVIITGEVVLDGDFGLCVQTPTYEYYKLGSEFEDYIGYDVTIELKHWTHDKE